MLLALALFASLSAGLRVELRLAEPEACADFGCCCAPTSEPEEGSCCTPAKPKPFEPSIRSTCGCGGGGGEPLAFAALDPRIAPQHGEQEAPAATAWPRPMRALTPSSPWISPEAPPPRHADALPH
ncbi:MAG: hypothetical protein AAF682_26720 [Planctomycetota bacterium]